MSLTPIIHVKVEEKNQLYKVVLRPHRHLHTHTLKFLKIKLKKKEPGFILLVCCELEAEFKSNVIRWAEEVSRQDSIQAMSWLLLTALSQVLQWGVNNKRSRRWGLVAKAMKLHTRREQEWLKGRAC